MRRFAASGSRRDLATCARLLAMAPGPEHIKRLMAGFEAAAAGRSLAGLPPELANALAKYSGQSVTLALRQRNPKRWRKQSPCWLTIAPITPSSFSSCKSWVRCVNQSASRLCFGSPANLLITRCGTAALATLAIYDDPAIGADVIKAYANMSDDVLASAQSLLVSRRKWAAQFLAAIEAKTIDPRSVRREDVEKLCSWAMRKSSRWRRSCLDRSSQRLRPNCVRRSTGSQARFTPVPACPSRAARSSTSNVARCHTLFSKGGKVGPDLTTYRRDDLENILLNIVNPSAEIREGYTTSIVAMTDGRILSGIVVEEDKNVVVLRGGDGKEAALARADIDAIRPHPDVDHARRPAQ